MRRILIFILLFLFPVQLLAGSITLALGRETNIDCNNNDRGTTVLFHGSAGNPEFSTGTTSGLFDCALSSGLAAGYSAMLLTEEDAENRDSYSRPQDYSPAGVIARSFLLPGLGQRRMGHSIRSKIYFVLEGAAWIGLGTFMWQSIARKSAYEDYAIAFAGVNGTERSDDYYETIGNYLSNEGTGGYNEDVMRDARDYYPDDRTAQVDYINENSITGADSWRWETDRAYDRYNSLRKGSNTAHRRAIYTLFYMLGIRVISSVDAGRTALSGNDSRTEHNLGTSIRIEQKSSGVSLFLSRAF